VCVRVFPGVVQAWRELPQPLWLRLDQHPRGDDGGGCRTQRAGEKISLDHSTVTPFG